MASSTPIISLDTAADPQASDLAPSLALPPQDEASESEDYAPAPANRIAEALPPVLAIALATGWSVLFLTANHSAMAAGGTAAQWAGWILHWSGPVALICLLYLVLIRNSRREAMRFVAAASALREESQALEGRLGSVNRELSLAREFMAAQGRDLDSLGRVAVERISQHAERLEGLVQNNRAQVETLGNVSSAALANMEQLRDHLPVINTSAKDVASNIGNVGRVAQAHVQEMVKGLNRLNDFGQASERQVVSIRERIEDGLAALEARTQQLDTVITGRFDALEDRSAGFSIDLERHESEAREALRQRAAIMAEEVAATRHRLDESEAEALTSLRARVAALRDEATNLGRALREGETAALTEWQISVARLGDDLSRFDSEVARRHEDAIERATRLGQHTEATTLRLSQAEARIEALTVADSSVAAAMDVRLDTLDRRLSETDKALEKLTDSSVRLLELIQSSASHSRDQLPAALRLSEDLLAAHEMRVKALQDAVEATKADGIALARNVAEAEAGLGTINALHTSVADQFATHSTALAGLGARLAGLEADTGRIATQAREELDSAVQALTDAARLAIQSIERDGAVQVAALAGQLANSSGAALERSMRLKASEIAGKLEQAAAHAIGVSSEAAEQLTSRLGKVEELTNHLEARVTAAREAAEDRIDHDFTRRMATITDTLQSAAVDIAGALDTEVADTAWAAYLKGDRGIFTRRAVKLLSTGDAKHVLHLYETNGVFQGQVNRYIHDFEAMLRHLLATRDGHAVSVTLLSSDMGKVYVALAQAIERLRN